MGLVGEMFERFMSRQSLFFNGLSSDAKEKLTEVENKYAVLRVTGPEGGIFYFRFEGQRLQLLKEPPGIPYEDLDKFILDGDLINYLGGDEVLFDVIDRSLSPREVVARHYFWVNTPRVIYDTEEFAQAFE
ncbi:hypothetical protein KKH23_05420, partial [Patescibacteria group bacterium]|nr:hypothetical protein [Patescibacteria group bacterium]